MNGTLYAMDMLQSSTGFMVSGLLGVLFGLFLEQAGFGSSRKLTGIFYFRDMTVIKVMLTAVLVCMVGYHYLVALGGLSPDQIYPLDTFWLSQILGGLLFGAGFVLGGWCPGTAFVGMASAKLDALVFVVGVALGSILFNELFPLIQPLYEGMSAGTVTLYDVLDFPKQTIVLTASLIAIAVFSLASLVEKGRRDSIEPSEKGWKRHGAAALLLVLFAAGLFVLPERAPLKAGPVARKGYLSEIVEARDHIDPLELADLLMKNEPRLILVDLRSKEDYDQFHIRGAIPIPLEDLPRVADDKLPRDGRIVLYSNGTTHAAQAWLELRHWGWRNVEVLTDGMLGFWRECLTPPSLRLPLDEASSKKAMVEFQARRDYFMAQDK